MALPAGHAGVLAVASPRRDLCGVSELMRAAHPRVRDTLCTTWRMAARGPRREKFRFAPCHVTCPRVSAYLIIYDESHITPRARAALFDL